MSVFVPDLPGFYLSFLLHAGGLCFHRVAKLSRAYRWLSSEEPLLGHFQVAVGLHLKVDQWLLHGPDRSGFLPQVKISISPFLKISIKELSQCLNFIRNDDIIGVKAQLHMCICPILFNLWCNGCVSASNFTHFGLANELVAVPWVSAAFQIIFHQRLFFGVMGKNRKWNNAIFLRISIVP